MDVIAVSAAATPERAWEALVEAFSQNVARPGAERARLPQS